MTVGNLRRLLALSAVMASLLAGCGDDTDGAEPDTGPAGTSDDTTGTPSDVLGEQNPASGTPVKVGFITDGGDCAECSDDAGFEQPTAEATVAWANEYLGGLAGHPIELVVCVDDLDPGKATDCANQMIADDIPVVVIGASGVLETSWDVLHDAGIPVVNFSATQEALVQDEASTFILQDSEALTVNLPLEVAKDIGAEQVSVIVINLPIATEAYEGETPGRFEEAGVELDVVPVDLGTPDMTPQAQQVVSNNSDGVVMITGHDQFCIPAINGLIAAGFAGTIVTISHCVTDAARDALPADVLDGMVLAATAPLGDDDPSMQQYNAVLEKYGASDVDTDSATPLAVYSAVSGLSLGTQTLEGDVTPESVIAALRAMENEVLPGTGGRYFRCNGKASTNGAATCMTSLLSATLDSDGNAVGYEVLGNTPIDD